MKTTNVSYMLKKNVSFSFLKFILVLVNNYSYNKKIKYSEWPVWRRSSIFV